MKQILTVLNLLFATITFGQISNVANSTSKIFDSLTRLARVDTLNLADIAGIYLISNGHAGYRLILYSNGIFEKIGFDCVSRSKVDSGAWNLKKGGVLVIRSGMRATAYDIIRLDNYYFLVSELQKQHFIKDYLDTKKIFKNARPFTINRIQYSVEFMIGYSLIEKYFAKELNGLTGT